MGVRKRYKVRKARGCVRCFTEDGSETWFVYDSTTQFDHIVSCHKTKEEAKNHQNELNENEKEQRLIQ